MLDFIPFDLPAVKVVQPYFATKTDRLCDWTPAGCYLWSSNYTYDYTTVCNCVIMRLALSFGYVYSLPMGGGDAEVALAALEAHCEQQGHPLRFMPLSPEQTQWLSERYGQRARIKPLPDYADYLYHYEDLATFAGRRYSGQRNHINQFVKKYPDWRYQPITPDLVPAVLAFADEYCRLKGERGDLSDAEAEDMNGVRAVLTAWGSLPLTGCAITVNGRIAGFSVGETIGDTLYVHVEKGDIRYPGIYQMLVREYAAHSATDGLAYINREDDAGEPGLRHSKRAYHPCAMAEKYSITVERD